MTDDLKAQLEARKAALEQESKELEEERLKIIETSIKPAQKRFNEIQERQLNLGGRYQEVLQLLGEKVTVVKAEEVKEEKKKK